MSCNNEEYKIIEEFGDFFLSNFELDKSILSGKKWNLNVLQSITYYLLYEIMKNEIEEVEKYKEYKNYKEKRQNKDINLNLKLWEISKSKKKGKFRKNKRAETREPEENLSLLYSKDEYENVEIKEKNNNEPKENTLSWINKWENKVILLINKLNYIYNKINDKKEFIEKFNSIFIEFFCKCEIFYIQYESINDMAEEGVPIEKDEYFIHEYDKSDFINFELFINNYKRPSWVINLYYKHTIIDKMNIELKKIYCNLVSKLNSKKDFIKCSYFF